MPPSEARTAQQRCRLSPLSRQHQTAAVHYTIQAQRLRFSSLLLLEQRDHLVLPCPFCEGKRRHSVARCEVRPRPTRQQQLHSLGGPGLACVHERSRSGLFGLRVLDVWIRAPLQEQPNAFEAASCRRSAQRVVIQPNACAREGTCSAVLHEVDARARSKKRCHCVRAAVARSMGECSDAQSILRAAVTEEKGVVKQEGKVL